MSQKARCIFLLKNQLALTPPRSESPFDPHTPRFYSVLACYNFSMIDLTDTAKKLFAPGKGILAIDESVASADKRLVQFGIKPSEEKRREFRELFLNAPGIEDYLSGVILHEETLSQKGSDNKLFPKSLHARGIIPGIKVDQGTEPFPDSPKELITKGVIGLCDRLIDFHNDYHTGFTKWRAVVRIDGDALPTNQSLVENARRLAVYARDAQEVSMVPIIEPEMLYEGKHSRARARGVLELTLRAVFDALEDHGVDLSGVILKTAMVMSGHETGKIDTPQEVAHDTLDVLMQCVPRRVPGIVFLSGGQTPEQATQNLEALSAKAKKMNAPWPLTFSYARALQEEALTVWAGKSENTEQARKVYIERLHSVSKALEG